MKESRREFLGTVAAYCGGGALAYYLNFVHVTLPDIPGLDVNIIENPLSEDMSDLSRILEMFDRSKVQRNDTVVRQVASGGVVHRDIKKYSVFQTLLLPSADPKKQIFIAPYHAFDDGPIEKREAVFYLGDRPQGKEEPGTKLKLEKIIAFSRAADLVIGHCSSPQQLNLSAVAFSNETDNSTPVRIVPGSTYQDHDSLQGRIINQNDSYILTNTNVRRGYSGSPLISGDGRVLGFVHSGLLKGSLRKTGDLSVRSAQLESVLRSCISSRPDCVVYPHHS
ncbi:hypothetical protein ACFL3V_05610 [Nanoarchaeota archaeon]